MKFTAIYTIYHNNISIVITIYMKVSQNRGTPSSHPFSPDFPHEPFAKRVAPVDGNPQNLGQTLQNLRCLAA